MTTPTAAHEPFSAEGAALIEAGYPLEAVEPLRQAVAGGEPSAPDLLARAYLESRSWHAAAEWLTPLVQAGHVRFAGALGLALVEVGDRTRAEDMLRLAVDSGDLTAANDNGPGQIVAAGTVEQLAAFAEDAPAKARLMPLSP